VAHADRASREKTHLGDGGRIALIAGGILAGVAAFYAGMIVGSGSDVPANTTVLGVQIGGMTASEAEAALERQIGPRAAAPLSLNAYESGVVIPAEEAGLTFDAAATVSDATGRLYNPLSLIQRIFASVEVAPVIAVDEAELTAAVEQFAGTVDADPVEPTVAYDGMTPVFEYGVAGRSIDIAGSVERIRETYLGSGSEVALIEVEVPPAISDERVDEFVRGFATMAVSAPVRVQAEEATASIQPEQIAETLSFTPTGDTFTPTLDGEFLHGVIEKDLKMVEGGGKDATFRIVDGVPVVVPHVMARGVASEDLGAAVIEAIAQAGDARVATVAVTVREPELTTEEAGQIGVQELVSTFTQSVPTIEYMQHNLALAAKYIDGTLLMPGDVFSMNGTTENRNPKNGYMEGYVIGPGGIFEKALGGGLSAATTTTFSAAFYAGLEIVELHQHSRYISRYQPGVEATVAWGAFDMKFKNDTPHAIFITASTTDSTMTVSMYGTKEYDAIESEIGSWYNTRKPAKVYNESEPCSPQGGIQGFDVDYDRVFYKDGAEVRRESFSASYLSAPEVICGPKPKKDKDKDKDNTSGSANPSGSATPSGSDQASTPPDQSESTAPDPTASGEPPA
jgi:vancomycin resistance protein YoaR